MTSPQSYEVIVLGGGKGGKTLATELGNKSVKMALIERSAEPGVQLLDMPDFPEAYKPEALADANSWTSCVRKKSWNGAFSVRPRNLRPVSAPGNSGLAKIVC